MQCSLISKALRSKTVKVQPASLDELCMQFKTMGGRTALVQLYREYPQDSAPGSAPDYLDSLPQILPAYRMVRLARGQQKVPLMPSDTIKSYNAVYQGLVLLSVDSVGSEQLMQLLKEEVMTLPSTVLAVTGYNGRSLKIIVAGTLEDGSLPTETEWVEQFHQVLAERATKLYSALLSVKLEQKPSTPLDTMRWTYDPDLRFRANVSPLLISRFDYRTGKGRSQYRDVQYDSSEPSLENSELCSRRYSSALQQAKLSTAEWPDKPSEAEMLGLVAKECIKFGIPQEDAVYQSAMRWRWESLTREQTRAIVESVYAESQPVAKPRKGIMQDTTLRLRQFMTAHYDLRFNELTNGVEYRPNHSASFKFFPMDSRVENTMIQEANEAGLEIMDRDMHRYLSSTRIRNYNAARAYLWEHENDWNGVTDHIGDLARRVPTSNPHWPQWFHTWFLGMVAQWLNWDRNHGNATVPLLIGPQGCGKSTFGQLLLPRELRSEGYRELVNFGNKDDVQRSLTSSLLINLDEFNQISEKTQQGFLKNLVQKTSFKGRRPYGSVQVELPRRASFIATSNFSDVLSDPSGSRRFIVAVIEGSNRIDTTTVIPYGALYSQAYRELSEGRSYYFKPEEQAAIEAYNASQTEQQPEIQHFYEVFSTTVVTSDNTQRLTLTQIVNEVTRQTKFHYNEAARNRLARHLALEVRKLKARRQIVSGYNVYHVVPHG